MELEARSVPKHRPFVPLLINCGLLDRNAFSRVLVVDRHLDRTGQ